MKVSNTAERLHDIMERRGLKQVDLLWLTHPYCKELGVKMNKSDISQYVNGKVEPQQEKLFVLAAALNVSEGWLMGYDVPMERMSDVDRFHRTTKIFNDINFPDVLRPVTTSSYPLLGDVACGEPIIANREYEVFSDGNNLRADAVVRAKGDSMTGAHIHDGDIVFIKYQNVVDNGNIACVTIESEETHDWEIVLKRFYRYASDLIVLRSENPAYKDMEFHGDEINRLRVIGKAVAFQSIIE